MEEVYKELPADAADDDDTACGSSSGSDNDNDDYCGKPGPDASETSAELPEFKRAGARARNCNQLAVVWIWRWLTGKPPALSADFDDFLFEFELIRRHEESFNTYRPQRTEEEDAHAAKSNAFDMLSKQFGFAQPKPPAASAKPARPYVPTADALEALPESSPYFIAASFPTIFTDPRGCPTVRPGMHFVAYCRYLLQTSVRAGQHPIFRYLVFNCFRRAEGSGGTTSFHIAKKAKTVPFDPKDKEETLRELTAITNAVPGSLGHKKQLGRKMEAFVDQIEEETEGQVPSLFTTLTSAPGRS